MGHPQMINTVEVINELWFPVGILVQQAEGSLAIRLVLRRAAQIGDGRTIRVGGGTVVHVPVWYGLPWEDTPPNGIPVDEIFTPVGHGPLSPSRR